MSKSHFSSLADNNRILGDFKPSSNLKTVLFDRRTQIPLHRFSLWKIEHGIARTLTWLEDGTTVTLGIWGTGDIIGKTLSQIEPYAIECFTEVEAIGLPDNYWSSHLEVILTNLQQFEELSVIRSYKRVDEMLFKLLIWLGKKFGREVTQGHLIDFRLTHQDIAELLNTTRVTITRTLKQLEQQGLIQRLERNLVVMPGEEFWYYEI